MREIIDTKFNRMVGQKVKFEAQFNKMIRTRNGNYRIVLLNVKEANSQSRFRDHVNLFVSNEQGKQNFSNLRKNDRIEFIATIKKYNKYENLLGINVRTENLGFDEVCKVNRIESEEMFKKVETKKRSQKKDKTKMTKEEKSQYDKYIHNRNLFKSLAKKGSYFKMSKDLEGNDVVVIYNYKNKKVKFITLDKIKPKYQRILDKNFSQIMSLLAINYQYYSRSVAKKEKLSNMKLDRLFVKDLNKFSEFL